MSEHYDVIVVGGGIVGLSAAMALSQRQLSVAVIDAGPINVDVKKPNVRVFAINHASKQWFQSLGVWDEMAQMGVSPYQHMHVWDDETQACIDLDARMIGDNKLGYIIEERVIKNALLNNIHQHNVTLLPNQIIDKVETNRSEDVLVHSADKHWHGSLLVVADGPKSTMRQWLNVKLTSWPYHQHALVAKVNTEKPHQQTAYQVFNADGTLAFLPLKDPYQCSIVWSTSPKKAGALVDMEEMRFNEQLQTAFASHLGQCALEGLRHQFPLTMRHVQQYHGHRWVIMGDAAHSIHPLAGLGLNLGLADVQTFISLMDERGKPVATQSLLGAYQRHRKYHVWQTIALMQGLKSLFISPLTPVKTLRGLGLNACNQTPFLKRLFIEQATGMRDIRS